MAEAICKICSKKFDTEESLSQHIEAKHMREDSKSFDKKKIKKYFLMIIVITALVIFSYTFYLRSQKPGQYDDFTKCLTEKGAVVYGNDYCQYTAKQLNYFDKSKKYLNYVKCSEDKELCDSKGVKVTPTWEINGKMYEQVQNFEKLSELSGCKI